MDAPPGGLSGRSERLLGPPPPRQKRGGGGLAL